jgi:hypothetical protein
VEGAVYWTNGLSRYCRFELTKSAAHAPALTLALLAPLPWFSFSSIAGAS